MVPGFSSDRRTLTDARVVTCLVDESATIFLAQLGPVYSMEWIRSTIDSVSRRLTNKGSFSVRMTFDSRQSSTVCGNGTRAVLSRGGPV